MKKILLLSSLLFSMVFSGAALADRYSQRGPSAHSGYSAHSAHRTVIERRRPVRAAPVVIRRSAPVIYRRSAPVVVYSRPTVVYREPVVVYREPVVVYSEPEVVYRDPMVIDEEVPVISGEVRGDNTVAKVVGAIAGGVIGSRFGGGHGRLATTAAGALLGSIIADELAR
jgi:outer membrane lipoprotein SlyB